MTTTDAIAELLIDVTAALARDGKAEAVEIPIINETTGAHETAELVVGVGNDVLSVPTETDGADPDFPDELASLRRHLDGLNPTGVVDITGSARTSDDYETPTHG